MKAMILVLSPKECVNLLNGDLSILVCKRFPKDYVGWVYIYVTKDSKKGWCMVSFRKSRKHYYQPFSKTACYSPLDEYVGNGKVVARFWCDKVEEFDFSEFSKYKDNLELYNECIRKDNELCKKACISCVQMVQYLDTKAIGKDMFGKAIHITKLEIFDKPKELVHHTHDNNSEFYIRKWDKKHECWRVGALTHAPRCGYCYIEV